MQKAIEERLATKNHILYIDILRIFSMISVVFLHTAAGTLRGNIASPLWHFANVLTSIMGSSVPIFFMISGAMLLSSEKTISINYTFKKRLPKVFFPFVSWSLVAVFYYNLMSYFTTGNFYWADVVFKLKNILSQPTTVHLWFMYVLIPLYILSPILKRLVDSLSDNLLRYLIILWFIFSSLFPTLATLLPKSFQFLFTLNSQYNLNFMTGYLGYFIMGYVLFRYDKTISKFLLTLILIVDTALISIGTWYKTIEAEQYSEVFKSYSKIFTLILSITLFLLLKEIFKNRSFSSFTSGLINLLSSASFGIYLIHNLLVSLVSRFFKLWPAQSILVLLGCFVIVFIISLLSIIVASSIRLTCFMFTGQTYKAACKSMNIQYFINILFKNKNISI